MLYWNASNISLYSLISCHELWFRKRLFNLMNELPTIFEVVTGAAKKQVKDKSSVSNHSSNKPKSSTKSVWWPIFFISLNLQSCTWCLDVYICSFLLFYLCLLFPWLSLFWYASLCALEAVKETNVCFWSLSYSLVPKLPFLKSSILWHHASLKNKRDEGGEVNTDLALFDHLLLGVGTFWFLFGEKKINYV